jgi:hypothetical protein
VKHKARTSSRIKGVQKLDRLKERLAHVKRDGQRVVLLPKREGAKKKGGAIAYFLSAQFSPRSVTLLTGRLGP